MSNRKQRDKNRANARVLKELFDPYTHICINCGVVGTHFVPPGFGCIGFFTCEKKQS